MKLLSILLFSTLGFANPMADTSSIESLEAQLPATIVVKDGQIVGTVDQTVANDDQAKVAVENALVPTKTMDEKDSHLSDSSNDSYYGCCWNRWGGYYNAYNFSYGFYYGANYFPYRPYFSWGGYGFYHYSYRPFYRPYNACWGCYRHYWW